MADTYPVVTACSYGLFHCPFFTVEHGTTPASERVANPGSEFLKALPGALRLRPGRGVSPQPGIHRKPQSAGPPPAALAYGKGGRHRPLRGTPRVGAFGAILGEKTLYALMKFSDAFDLIALEKGFREEALGIFQSDDALARRRSLEAQGQPRCGGAGERDNRRCAPPGDRRPDRGLRALGAPHGHQSERAHDHGEHRLQGYCRVRAAQAVERQRHRSAEHRLHHRDLGRGVR